MKLKLYSMAIVFILLLVGCNTNQNDGAGNNIEPTRYNDNNFNNRDTGLNPDGTPNINNRYINNRNNNGQQGDRYDISEEAAERIENEIDEIDEAYVLTTGNNAYVAAVLDNDDRNRDRNNGRNNSDDGNRHDGDINETRNTRHMGNRNNDRNFFDNDEVSDDVKNRIADIVQSVDRDIDNVYVTTSPDFVDLTNNYMNDFNDGRPVEGFFDQIGNMIERVFPQNRR